MTSSPESYDLTVTWAGQPARPWTVCHSEESAQALVEAMWADDLEIERIRVERVSHQAWCGVTSVACTCQGLDKRLVVEQASGPLRWQARREARRAQLAAQAGLASRPHHRSRLSPLAERLSSVGS